MTGLVATSGKTGRTMANLTRALAMATALTAMIAVSLLLATPLTAVTPAEAHGGHAHTSTGGIPKTAPKSSRWGSSYLPNAELQTQDGRTVRFYDDVIKGKIVVISFIYTSCLDVCPLITARLAQVYDALGEVAGRDIHFVSISIDPENDTPDRLKRHAEAFRSDGRWLFLTGKPDDVKIVRYKLGERSRKITEHGSQIMLYNDRTGEWHKDSAFGDLGVLTATIRNMDPVWRGRPVDAAAAVAKGVPKMEAGFDAPGQALFVKACASCHSVGGGVKVGPDLYEVTQRRPRAWLARFIRAPQKLHAEGDAVARELAAQYPDVRMPNLQLSDADVQDLLTYLDARTFAVTAADMERPHGADDEATAETATERAPAPAARPAHH